MAMRKNWRVTPAEGRLLPCHGFGQALARRAILRGTGMIGLDEGGWDPAASREAPSS